eukprot:scaffold3210_cov402-Prasinococcus_capsulatus_cf.AAC.25
MEAQGTNESGQRDCEQNVPPLTYLAIRQAVEVASNDESLLRMCCRVRSGHTIAQGAQHVQEIAGLSSLDRCQLWIPVQVRDSKHAYSAALCVSESSREAYTISSQL